MVQLPSQSRVKNVFPLRVFTTIFLGEPRVIYSFINKYYKFFCFCVFLLIMHKKICVNSQLIDKKTIPIINFKNNDLQQSKKNLKLKTKSIIVHSQKQLLNSKNKNLQVIYKISSTMSQPLHLRSSKPCNSIVLSPSKNPHTMVVVKKKNIQQKYINHNVQEKTSQNYKKFPVRYDKFRNNSPYKHYLFKEINKEGNAMDRFYSQQFRARTARQRINKAETIGNLAPFRIASGQRQSQVPTYKQEKFLSPWDDGESNREDYFIDR